MNSIGRPYRRAPGSTRDLCCATSRPSDRWAPQVPLGGPQLENDRANPDWRTCRCDRSAGARPSIRAGRQARRPRAARGLRAVRSARHRLAVKSSRFAAIECRAPAGSRVPVLLGDLARRMPLLTRRPPPSSTTSAAPAERCPSSSSHPPRSRGPEQRQPPRPACTHVSVRCGPWTRSSESGWSVSG